MKSQWECLLQNLGEWHGSFTQISPQGEIVADTPTIVSFEGLNDNQMMRQVVRRFLPDPSHPGQLKSQDKVLEYSSLGRGTLFFEDGAFSQGSLQWGPFSEFGAEMGLIRGDRRLRLVQLFNKEGYLDGLTLIREKLAGAHAADRPMLTVDDLIGAWRGEARTIYPDWRSPDVYPTVVQLQREGDRLSQQITFGSGATSKTIRSTAKIDGSILHFDQGASIIQVLLLPDGASSTCPLQIKPRQSCFLEVGWLIQPDLRQRMIRSYDDKGAWISLTLVTEHKSA